MGSRSVVCAAAALAAAGAGAASAATMHPRLGARLAGMGEHGIVNITAKASRHELCWTFDIPTAGVTRASIRDAHGMVLAKLGARFAAKGCAMSPPKAIRLVEAKPAAYRVWVDTKGHPGELRGRLVAGMVHM